MTIDQQFIEFIVKGLVGNPDDVSIERTIDEKGVLLELTVNPEDLGRVIGKRGNTAQSMRTLLRALGTKNDARYNLKIVDNGVPKPERRQRNEEDSASNNDDQQAPADDASTDQPEEKPQAKTAAPAPAPAADDSDSAGSSQWSHLSSSSDASDAAAPTEAKEESSTSSTDDVLAETKKELADLDDLNL